MKNKNRISKFLMITVFMTMIVSLNATSIFAANGKITNGSVAGNLFESTGKGPKTDHTSCTYSIDDEPAWCIDAGVDVVQGDGYNETGEVLGDAEALSWLMYNSNQKGGGIDNQIVQAAIWILTGNSVWSVGGSMDQVNSVIEQARHCNDGRDAASASISVDGSNDFIMDDTRNAYVSPIIRTANSSGNRIDGAPVGSDIIQENGGYRIVVPATAVTSDMDITFIADCNSTAERYAPARVFRKTGSQTLIKPAMTAVAGNPASTSFHLRAVGKSKLGKVDEHEKPVQGATFRVTGPEYPEGKTFITDANGSFETGNIAIGTYTIVETSVPANLVLDPTPRTINVVSGTTATISVKDYYQRGRASLAKADVFTELGKKNYGNGSFLGTEVELHVGPNDIYEGETKVLNANERVATRTVKLDGTVDEVKEFNRESDGKYFDGLPLGEYYWIEVKPHDSYLMPSESTVIKAQKTQYELTFSYEGMNKEYTEQKSVTMLDQQKYTAVSVYKMDNSNQNDDNQEEVGEQGPDDKNPAVGARLRLTLKSNYNEETGEPIDPTHDTYEADVDKYGKAEFINPEFAQKFQGTGISMKYTIPWGEYVLDEIKESNDGNSYFYGIQNETIQAKINNKTESTIVMDNPIPVSLEVVKKDAETHEVVAISGTKFKVWDLKANNGKGGWLVQHLGDGSHDEISEFTTNDQGHFILPEKIYAGEYIIYETQAPEGYYLEDKYRIPKENGVEKPGTNGLKINITNIAVNVEDVEEYPEGGIKNQQQIVEKLKYTVDIEDRPLKGKIDLYKEGEMFTNVKQNTSEYPETEFNEILEETEPVYEMRPLEKVKFEVVAKENIYTKDGRLQEAKGTKHYLTTKSDGHGRCTVIKDGKEVEEELYCGTYTVTEIETPAGYEPCKPFEAVVENKDQYERVKILNKDAENKYIPAPIKFNKLFKKDKEGISYRVEGEDPEEERAYAVFGIYNKNELTAVNGNVTIPAETLIQSFVVYDGDPYTKTMKLPDGEYYFEELYAKGPWVITDDEGNINKYDFTINHKKGETAPIDIEIEAVDTYTSADFSLIKISTTAVLQNAGLTLTSTDVDNEEVKAAIDAYTQSMNDKLSSNEITVDDILKDLRDSNITLLGSAEYEVYVDEECTKHLQISTDSGKTYNNVVVTSEVMTDELGNKVNSGLYSLKYVPAGIYYVKERKAPVYTDANGNIYEYEVSNEVVMIEAAEDAFTEVNNVLFKALVDEAVDYTIEKVDIFTGKKVPNCLFTITDEEDNELLRFMTNEEGEAHIPTDIFEDEKYYFFTELEAEVPFYYDEDGKLYELNTTPHKFQAHIDEDGKWKLTYIDEEGNEVEYDKPRILNYRPVVKEVYLTKLDMMDSTPVPNCKFELRSKETDFVIEGVTDENGVYIFKDVPYGEYTYTELEAPAEYLIDTTPHDITIDKNDIKIVVYDLKAPDTGDIAVVAIAVLAVVCVAGIVFVIVKNKKSKSTK